MSPKLTLVVDNQSTQENYDLQKMEEKLLGLTSIAKVLKDYPILQESYNLSSISYKIKNLKNLITEKRSSQGESLIFQTKERFSSALNKRELQVEVLDFCKSIRKTLVCEKEITFEINFHHHVLIGVMPMFRLNESCCVSIFTGISGEGVKYSALLYMPDIISQEEMDSNMALKKEVAHSVLSQGSLSLTEAYKEFLCKELGIVYGENNILEFNTSKAKILDFNQNNSSTGPFAG